jgi:hypothetical protein
MQTFTKYGMSLTLRDLVFLCIEIYPLLSEARAILCSLLVFLVHIKRLSEQRTFARIQLWKSKVNFLIHAIMILKEVGFLSSVFCVGMIAPK